MSENWIRHSALSKSGSSRGKVRLQVPGQGNEVDTMHVPLPPRCPVFLQNPRGGILSVIQGPLPPFVQTCLVSFLNITVTTPSWHYLVLYPFIQILLKMSVKMEFSKDLVKVSSEAVLYKSSALTPWWATSYAVTFASNTFHFHPLDGKPAGSSHPTPHTAHFLGFNPWLECHFFFKCLST